MPYVNLSYPGLDLAPAWPVLSLCPGLDTERYFIAHLQHFLPYRALVTADLQERTALLITLPNHPKGDLYSNYLPDQFPCIRNNSGHF